MVLVKFHKGVEDRCKRACNNAFAVGDALIDEVKKVTGEEMGLNFVTKAQAETGITTSTYAFNLPPVKGGSEADNEALA